MDGTPNGLVFCAKGDPCNKMIRENRECVTVHPFVTFSGEKCLCHVVFAAKGITSHMAPAAAVKKIPNLLISTTEHGSQTHESLLAAYKSLNAYLSSKNVAHPVVIIADGHSSRFDTKVLKFLKNSNMRLHITPPDTTGVTQLLDQLNQSLYSEYRDTKNNLFSPECTINREGFTQIRAGIWETWTDSDSIANAGKRVGVSKKGVGMHWMQQDKFAQAVSVMR